VAGRVIFKDSKQRFFIEFNEDRGEYEDANWKPSTRYELSSLDPEWNTRSGQKVAYNAVTIGSPPRSPVWPRQEHHGDLRGAEG